MNHTTNSKNDHNASARFAHLGEGRYGMLPVDWMPFLKGDQMIKVFWALCAHVGPDGTCFPSRMAIAKMCGIHPKNITAILRKLESIKAISTIAGSGRQASHFRILPPPSVMGAVESTASEAVKYAPSEAVELTASEGVESTARNRPRTDHLKKPKEQTSENASKPVDNFLENKTQMPKETEESERLVGSWFGDLIGEKPKPKRRPPVLSSSAPEEPGLPRVRSHAAMEMLMRLEPRLGAQG